LFDYASVPLEEKYVREHKVCSIPAGVLALAESIIELAINDIINNHGRDQALSYVLDDDLSYPLSFLNICSLLQVGPGQIRRSLAAFLKNHKTMPKRKRGRPAGPSTLSPSCL
jgi:hypothetical protein